MLRTNSKKARDNVRTYIVDHFTPYDLDDTTPPTDTGEIFRYIYNIFLLEKYHTENERRYYGYVEGAAFTAWCEGLPSVLDTCYYYNRSAVEDLGDILEQTETERNRYSEQAAEKLLTYMIYREIKKEVTK